MFMEGVTGPRNEASPARLSISAR